MILIVGPGELMIFSNALSRISLSVWRMVRTVAREEEAQSLCKQTHSIGGSYRGYREEEEAENYVQRDSLYWWILSWIHREFEETDRSVSANQPLRCEKLDFNLYICSCSRIFDAYLQHVKVR